MERDPDLGQATHATVDVAELRERMARFAVPHTLEPLGVRGEGVTTGVDLGRVKLAFVRYGAPTRVVAAGTGPELCWTIPIGTMDVAVDQHRGSLAEGFLLDQANPTIMLPSTERGAVVVTTTEMALRFHLGKLMGARAESLSFAPGPSRFRDKGQVNLAWRYVASSLAMVGAPPTGLASSLGETLLTALLFELQPTGRLPVSSSERVSKLHGRRAAEWAAEHFASPVQVTEWADAVNISVRHLQAVIRAEFGCTPKEYLTELRLQRARALMRQADAGRTVTSVAAEAGFTHLGRFAALYRQRFGTSPSLDR